MKKVLVTLLALSFLAVGAAAVFAAGPSEVTLSAKMGDVTFPHDAHQEIVSDCTTCHHTGLSEPNCHSCHGVDDAAPKTKDAFHKSCKGCHKEQGGPTGCKDCLKR